MDKNEIQNSATHFLVSKYLFGDEPENLDEIRSEIEKRGIDANKVFDLTNAFFRDGMANGLFKK